MLITSRMWTLICVIYLFGFCTNGEAQTKKKSCVVGAGGGGLAMIKELCNHPDDFEPIAFERNSDVGGLWIYTDDSDVDQYGLPVHSAVYKNMRTNSPKSTMHFEGYEIIGNENRTCVKHDTVLEYLRNYTEQYNLRQYIRFNTLVEKVTPILNDNGDSQNTKWRVQTRDLLKNQIDVTVCDTIIICNGRNVKPHIPKISGIESFPGKIMHSHAYRKPEDFMNQTVVLLGAGKSGVDIAVDLGSYAREVYLSHRHEKIRSEWPDNVEQVRGVVAADGNQLILSDNTTITVDTFIYSTGYDYDIPFLDKSSGITVESKYVYPLRKHIVNARYPSMAIFGLPTGFVLHFAIFNVQAKYYVALLQGKLKLPSLEKRLGEAKLPVGVSKDRAHNLEKGQWVYYKDLADEAGFQMFLPSYEKILDVWGKNMRADWPYFKQSELVIEKDGRVQIDYPNGRGSKFHEF